MPKKPNFLPFITFASRVFIDGLFFGKNLGLIRVIENNTPSFPSN